MQFEWKNVKLSA